VNLILLEDVEVGGDGRVTLDGVRGEHLRGVLHATPGQEVRVGLLDGPLGVGTVTSVGESGVELQCAFDAAAPPRPKVDLLLALPRPKVMRRLWAQIAALGVGQIVLTNAARVERNYFDAHVLAPDGYRPLLVEGLQQARDTRLPVVSIHRQFRILVEDALDRLFPDGLRLLADPGAAAPPERVVRAGRGARVLLAVGPEGGWNDFERDLLAAHGFRAVSMGARTLRTDTACIALLARVHAALPDGLLTDGED
jgi:RsmE family RNA methyltransferase